MFFFFFYFTCFFLFSFAALCAGIAAKNISITRTAFRNQPEQPLGLNVELELRRVHHRGSSSAKLVNSEGRSPSSDTNTGRRRSWEISCSERSIQQIQHREYLKRTEMGSGVQEQTGIFSVLGDRSFHTICFYTIFSFSVDSNDSLNPQAEVRDFVHIVQRVTVCIECAFR